MKLSNSAILVILGSKNTCARIHEHYTPKEKSAALITPKLIHYYFSIAEAH